MAPYILSVPAPLPAPVESAWQSLSLVWVGWDGSEWDLNSREQGAMLFRRGVEGLHNPSITRHTSTSRGVPGNRLRGWRAEARAVFWPIYLWGDDSEEWRARHNAFFRSIHPDREGKWLVTAGTETRTLRLTGTFDEPHQYDIDPQLHGWAQYGVTLEAAQPFWEGSPVVSGPWQAANPVDFFGDGGPPFHISSQSSFEAAAVTNPGDIETWGKWTAVGPLTAVELGVAGAVIDLPFAIPDGKTLVIDTSPRNQTATLGDTVADPADFVGEDVTEELGLQNYAPVPDGAEAELHIAATGTGSIQFEITPLYFRAF